MHHKARDHRLSKLFSVVKYVRVWAILTLKMASSGMLRRVALVRADVSEELSASIIKVTRIGELGT
jgi:hypothetical protein